MPPSSLEILCYPNTKDEVKTWFTKAGCINITEKIFGNTSLTAEVSKK